MTYDELLAKINNLPEVIGLAEFKVRHDALRAVVELHKVQKCDCNCSRTHEPICDECIEDYPCPTIQAIEKELS